MEEILQIFVKNVVPNISGDYYSNSWIEKNMLEIRNNNG